MEMWRRAAALAGLVEGINYDFTVSTCLMHLKKDLLHKELWTSLLFMWGAVYTV